MAEPVILDACCTLTLSATGRIEEILGNLPHRFCVGVRARAETQYLRVEGSTEREPVNLQTLFNAGLLTEEQVHTPDEQMLYVGLAASLAGGEAEAAALAISRGYILATDERKARNLMTRQFP